MSRQIDSERDAYRYRSAAATQIERRTDIENEIGRVTKRQPNR